MHFPSMFRILENKEKIKDIMPISTTIFLYAFSMGLISPIFSVYVNGITQSLFLTGLILSLFGLAGTLLSIPYGILVQKHHTKKIIQVSLLVKLALFAAFPSVHTFWLLFVLYFTYSAVSALFWVAVWSYIFDHLEKGIAGEELGVFTSFYDLAYSAAPLLTGILTGLTFFLPFHVMLVFLGVAFLFSFKLDNKFIPTTTKSSKDIVFDGFRLVKENWKFVLPLLTFTIFAYGVLNLIFSFLPVLLKTYNFSYGQIGFVMAISSLPAVMFEIPLGYLADRIQKKWVVFIGLLVLGGAIFLLASAKAFNSVLAMIFIIGAISVAFVNVIHVMVSILLSDKEKGMFSGILTTNKNFGNFLGPFIGGILLNFFGFASTFKITAIASIVFAVPMLILFWKDC